MWKEQERKKREESWVGNNKRREKINAEQVQCSPVSIRADAALIRVITSKAYQKFGDCGLIEDQCEEWHKDIKV